MNTKGLRILDVKNGKCIPLFELLVDIPTPNQLNWALLWLDVTPTEGNGKLITELQQKINKSDHGLFCTFEFLTDLSEKIFQEIEILIVGCKVKENIHRYKEDKEMYETCDIVIEMIDGGFWEIFSKTPKWIDHLAKKYTKVEVLRTDFQK